MLLLDADVMIDVIRRHPPAVKWMSSHRAEQAALPGMVVLQLLDGCSTEAEATQLRSFLDRFRRFWPTVADHERAEQAFSDIKLAHGLDIIDMLIAQTAIGLGSPLLTFNTKHLRAVPGLTITQPYTR